MKHFLRERPRPAAEEAPQRLCLSLPGEDVAITVRRIESARRMTLRIPPGHADPVVTVPARASRAAIERFVRSQEAWLSARLAERTPPIPFAHGAEIPLRGEPHVIRRIDAVRGTVVAMRSADGPVIRVPSQPEHLPRRVADYMRRTARADLAVVVGEFAERVGRRPAAVRIKDTRAQWGSCSPAGVLSFSWRLVLAPPFVLRYVAAHEVAHLVELNHSPAFWRLNAELDPNHREARQWLKRHGRMLHAVGAGRGGAH